jgi:hypothetical protein
VRTFAIESGENSSLTHLVMRNPTCYLPNNPRSLRRSRVQSRVVPANHPGESYLSATSINIISRPPPFSSTLSFSVW